MPVDFIAHAHNQDAERSVLGAMFLDPDALEDAAISLVADDFYEAAHREIFTVAAEIYAKRQAFDLVTVGNALKQRGTLLAVGGAQYITDVARYVPSAANVGSYIKIVRDHAALRRLTDLGRAVVGATERGDDAQEIISKTDRELQRIQDRFVVNTGDDSMRAILRETYDAISDAEQGKNRGLKMGVHDIDRMTGGFFPDELTVVGARPGVGKSDFALNLANAFARKGKQVLFFSLEMSHRQLGIRQYAYMTSIDRLRLRLGQINDAHYSKLADAMTAGSELPVNIDISATTPNEIRARCRKQMREPVGLGAVIIDYLQIVKPNGKYEKRLEAMTEITWEMHKLSREIKCPLIAMAQLNRESAGRGSDAPTLGQFRESGTIEQDADNAILLHTPKQGRTPDEAANMQRLDEAGMRLLDVSIAKQRQGMVGTASIAYDPTTGRIMSLDALNGRGKS